MNHKKAIWLIEIPAMRIDPDNENYAVISIYWYQFSSILYLQDIQLVLSFVQL